LADPQADPLKQPGHSIQLGNRAVKVDTGQYKRYLTQTYSVTAWFDAQQTLPTQAFARRSRRMTKTYRIASVPADGIGPEVISAGLEVLDAVASRDGGFKLVVDHYDWGSNWYRKHGEFMPADGLAWLRTADAIYFGAVGDPDIPDHISLWGLRLQICQGFDQYANVRPTRILPGVTSPLRDVGTGDLDWVIVRENSEGEYAGQGGRTHRGLPEEVATETAIFTRRGVERIMRFAFDIARSRPRKHLTVVTKSNAQRHGMVFWDEIAALVSHDYKDVTWDKELVDAMTMRMVRKPQSIDTVVATNLHADILSDLAAALAGSLGIAPTGNIDPERRSPSMFEPIHGSAFDITGKGIANPVATFWTGAMMLEHLGEKPAADLLMRAVEQVCAAGILSPDLGGKATTAEVTRAVAEAVRGMNR
jgi:tartrate dehydrogenase/decarboxylase/D-malate dehydrogenase